MSNYVLGFHEIDQTQVAVVGGKGAHLGELERIEGLRVPPGFCVTAQAFRRVLAAAAGLEDRLDQLARLQPEDRDAIHLHSADVRNILAGIVIPDELRAPIVAALDERAAYAVRSSATAEDLPTASFAGQHDTYLNIVGAASILQHISRCWASLFTERAVTYRLRIGLDHRKVHMAVVVQQMVLPQAAGVLFTADPVTGHRKVLSIEASFGLGEALVSGLVNADIYKVRDGAVIARTLATPQPALTDTQALRLAQLGRRIEAHFGRPQDIEWCLVDDDFHIVQSRPITTLFPIPTVADQENHIYVSVGHQQMMTDPMTPLGLSVWQLTTPRPMSEAGGRLFVDVSGNLATPAGRDNLMGLLGRSDPLIGDAIQTLLDRPGFIRELPDAGPVSIPTSAPIETDPSIVTELIRASQTSIAALERDIQMKSGTALLDFILEDLEELKRILFAPRSRQAIMTGMEATWWLNEHLQVWLGEKNAADKLTQSVPHNITSAMGLALLDVADVIRPHADVVAFLQQVEDDNFLDELPKVAGGQAARDAIRSWLDDYGMRGVGEIDITRPRWSERPTLLVPVLLGNIRNFEAGASARRFQQGQQEAREQELELLERLRALPDGASKAAQTKQMIDRVRTFAGYREYPKYGMVSRYFIYKQALLQEARRLVHAGVLREQEDIFYLRFQELQDVVRTHHVDEQLLRERKDAFGSYRALSPPRVFTSDGEIIAGTYRRGDVPTGALVGLPVSAGTIEGRARVILDMARANLEAGDILVTAYTDPSWTPLFVGIKGLVTEVGGLMTHGAVIAREYGLPAVVGVEHATRLIRDGQRIRVNGTDGYVAILS